MKSNSLGQTKPGELEEKFFREAEQIKSVQNEISDLEEQLDKFIQSITNHETPQEKIIDFDNMLVLKQISEELEIKKEVLKKSVIKLYHSVFPGDIFIMQNFFNVWISVKPNWVIRFSDDLESIEMKMTTQ